LSLEGAVTEADLVVRCVEPRAWLFAAYTQALDHIYTMTIPAWQEALKR
jgi:hypothetical protein